MARPLPVKIIPKSVSLSSSFIILIIYSLFTLIILGLEFSGLYGNDDVDIPTDAISAEIIATVQQV